MKIMNCKTAHKELDEIFPNGNLNADIREHLVSCTECGELYKKQSQLQQVLGTLEAVSVPNDFDFRLRARLREPQRATAAWWMKSSSVALGAALCLFVTFLLSSGFFVTSRVVPVSEGAKSPTVAEGPKQFTSPTESVSLNPHDVANVPAAAVSKTKVNGAVHQFASIRSQRRGRPEVMDFSSEGASRITSPIIVRESPAFPIDAPAQGLRLSFDDGRGNARTISFPTVSFGSQRVLTTNANQLQSKGIW